MTIIKLKTKLQSSILGRILLKLYHYTVSVPLTYYYRIKYLTIRSKIENIKFIPDNLVFDLLTNSKTSLCRFGDGEISWIYRDSKGYFGQENSEELSIRLREVLNSANPNILIGVPAFFGEMKEYDKRRKNSRCVHLAKYGKRWMTLLDKNKEYADALITRVYLGRRCNHTEMFSKWKTVWENKDVVIVEGKDTKFGIGNDLVNNALSIKRILVPSENAFAKYDKILNTVIKQSPDSIYLLAIGPTATVLAYDLGMRGYQAIDIGHLDIEYEWFLRQTDHKIQIEGKYVNETGGMSSTPNKLNKDLEYNKQIIDTCYE